MGKNYKKKTGHLRRASESPQKSYHDRKTRSSYPGSLNPLASLPESMLTYNITSIFVKGIDVIYFITSTLIVFCGIEEEAIAEMKGGA